MQPLGLEGFPLTMDMHCVVAVAFFRNVQELSFSSDIAGSQGLSSAEAELFTYLLKAIKPACSGSVKHCAKPELGNGIGASSLNAARVTLRDSTWSNYRRGH